MQSIQVCFGGDHWPAGCDAIWVIAFFAAVAVVSVVVLAIRRWIQEYMHRRAVNKWFAEQATAQQDQE